MRMEFTVPFQLFAFISKVLKLQNPILLLSLEESNNADLCLETSFPVVCAGNGKSEVLDYLESQLSNSVPSSVLLSQGDHRTLVTEWRESPHLFGQSNVWIIPLEYEHMLPLRLDSRVVLYNGSDTDGYSLHESYAVNGGAPITQKVSEWHPKKETNEEIKLLENVVDKRSNLNGVVIRYSWFHNPPFVRFVKDSSGVVVNYGGFYVDIFSELKSRLNFTAEYIPAKPGEKWGGKTRNGTWNGMVGMLMRDEIDYSAIACGINQQRQQVVDFSFPIRGNLFTALTSTTTKPKLNVWAYMQIFPSTAWAGLAALLVFGALGFSFASRESFSESLGLMMRLLIQLGHASSMRGRAAKAMLLVSALGLNLLFIYYTGDLTAKMTSAPPKVDIGSFEDVKELGYRVIYFAFGLRMDLVMRAAPEGSAMRWVYDEQIKDNDDARMTTLAATFKRAAEEPKVLAYTIHRPWTEDTAEKQLVPLDITEKLTIYEGSPMQKNSEFLELFTHHTVRLQESGVLGKLKSKWLAKAGEGTLLWEAISLGYDNVLFPFALVASGSLVAAIIITAEIGYKCYANMK